MNRSLIISNRFKRALHNKKSFLITILIPIIAVIIGSVSNSLSAPQLNIAVTSDIAEVEAKALAENLKHVKGVKSRYYDALSNKTDLIMGHYDIVLKLHDDGSILYSTIRKSTEEPKVRQLISDISAFPNHLFSIEDYLVVDALSSIEKILSFMVLMLLITCTVNASFIIQDKRLGLYKRVKSSPLPMSQYIAGNILYNFIITYAQIILAMVIVYLIGVNLNLQFSHMLFIGCLMSLVTTSFGTMMAVLFDNELYANLFSSLMALIVSLFGGTFIAFAEMPNVLKTMSILSPTRWFIKMAESLNSSASLIHLVPYIVLALLFTTAAFTLSAALTLKRQ